MPQPSETPGIQATGLTTPAAARAAAERAARDLALVYERTTITPGEAQAWQTVRFVLGEVADGDRRVR